MHRNNDVAARTLNMRIRAHAPPRKFEQYIIINFIFSMVHRIKIVLTIFLVTCELSLILIPLVHAIGASV